MINNKPIAFLLLITFFVACAPSASFTNTGPTFAPFTGPVKVFFETPQDSNYDEIGIVSTIGYAGHTQTDLISALQKKAASYGANAIIIVSSSAEKNAAFSSTMYGTFGGTSTKTNMTAIAILIKN